MPFTPPRYDLYNFLKCLLFFRREYLFFACPAPLDFCDTIDDGTASEGAPAA